MLFFLHIFFQFLQILANFGFLPGFFYRMDSFHMLNQLFLWGFFRQFFGLISVFFGQQIPYLYAISIFPKLQNGGGEILLVSCQQKCVHSQCQCLWNCSAIPTIFPFFCVQFPQYQLPPGTFLIWPSTMRHQV